MLVIWDVESGKSLYGSPNREVVNEILFFNNDNSRLVAVQQNGIQILSIDKVYKKVKIKFILRFNPSMRTLET